MSRELGYSHSDVTALVKEAYEQGLTVGLERKSLTPFQVATYTGSYVQGAMREALSEQLCKEPTPWDIARHREGAWEPAALIALLEHLDSCCYETTEIHARKGGVAITGNYRIREDGSDVDTARYTLSFPDGAPLTEFRLSFSNKYRYWLNKVGLREFMEDDVLEVLKRNLTHGGSSEPEDTTGPMIVMSGGAWKVLKRDI